MKKVLDRITIKRFDYCIKLATWGLNSLTYKEKYEQFIRAAIIRMVRKDENPVEVIERFDKSWNKNVTEKDVLAGRYKKHRDLGKKAYYMITHFHDHVMPQFDGFDKDSLLVYDTYVDGINVKGEFDLIGYKGKKKELLIIYQGLGIRRQAQLLVPGFAYSEVFDTTLRVRPINVSSVPTLKRNSSFALSQELRGWLEKDLMAKQMLLFHEDYIFPQPSEHCFECPIYQNCIGG